MADCAVAAPGCQPVPSKRSAPPPRPPLSRTSASAQETELAGDSGTEIVAGDETVGAVDREGAAVASSAAQNVGATHDTACRPAPTRTG